MTGAAPRLTVGLPVFNGARYLERAATSVLDQTFGDLELIISDNASSDDTESIGRTLAERDPRVTYRRNAQNIGLAANFNLLVPLARGRLFKWASADDELRPGYLERCVATLEDDVGVVVAYPRTDFIDGDGNPLDLSDPGWHLTSDEPADRLLPAILAGGFVNAVLGVIRTDALQRTRLLPRYSGGDYRLMAELSLLGKVVEIPEALYVRRIHATSSKGNAADTRWLRRYMSGSGSGLRASYWRLCIDRAGIVVGAPIPVRRKAIVLAHVVRQMLSHRRRLATELFELLPRRS